MHYWPLLIFLAPLLLSPLEVWARRYRGAPELHLIRRAAVVLLLATGAVIVLLLARAWQLAEEKPAIALEALLLFFLGSSILLLLLFALLRPRRHTLPTPRQFERPPSLLLSIFLCSVIGMVIANTVAGNVAGFVASHAGWERPDHMPDIFTWIPRDLGSTTLILLATLLVCATVSCEMVVQNHRSLLRGEAYRSPLSALFLIAFACQLFLFVLFDKTYHIHMASAIFWIAVALHHYLLLFRIHWEVPYFLTAADFEPLGPLASQTEGPGAQ